MLQRTAGLLSLALLVNCSEDVSASSHAGNAGAGGGGNTGAGGAGAGGGTGGDGPVGKSPEQYTQETCLARAACGGDPCEQDALCWFAMLRPDLRDAFQQCYSQSCVSADVCFEAADRVPPPSEFAAYEAACSESSQQCGTGGNEWCNYHFFSAQAYTEMLACFELPCAQADDCPGPIVFDGYPGCTGI